MSTDKDGLPAAPTGVYDVRSDWQQVYQRRSHARVLGRVQKAASILDRQLAEPRLRLLDIGCGDGTHVDYVAQALGMAEKYGVDISDVAAKSAEERGVKASAVNIDIDTLPYADGYFDGVMSTETIEHLLNPDHLLSEMYRVLRPGGVAVLTTPNMAWWMNRIVLAFGWQPFSYEPSRCYSVGHPPVPLGMNAGDTGHISTFTRGALKQLMRLHGFEVVGLINQHFRDCVLPEWLPLYMKPALPVDSLLGSVPSFSFGTIIAGRK